MSKRLSIKNRGLNIQHPLICVLIDRALDAIVTGADNPTQITVRYNTVYK